MNKAGPRVETRETWGLFCKMYRPNRYLRFKAGRSRSGGSSLMGSRSNLGRCLQIGRPRVKGARGGGGRSPEQSSATGAAPEYAVSGVPGAIWDGVWPWSTIAAWVIHWCAQVRGFRARSGLAMAQAALRLRSSPAACLCHAGGRLRAQKGHGASVGFVQPGLGFVRG